MSATIEIHRGELGDFDQAVAREWLVTNGLGGYACGTASGACTRRYHGLLVAALKPPLLRTLMVAKLEVTADYAGRTYHLATNEFHDGTIAPRGFELLDEFRLEAGMPVWRYVMGDAILEQRVWMAYGANTSYLSLELKRATSPVALSVTPLVTYRDFHQQTRGPQPIGVKAIGTGLEVTAGAVPYRVFADRGTFATEPEWYWDFKHRAETARGLDDREDLFRPGVLSVDLEQAQQVIITMTTETSTTEGASVRVEQKRRNRRLLRAAPAGAPEWIRQLVLASDQFIVARDTADGRGKTVIAGYPWFGDWGRDTMIALPGLTLATGRHDVAAEVLRTFAGFVDQGMLPNRFPDSGEEPEYNTVDATLWYFHALDLYERYSGDLGLAQDLYPTLKRIVDCHLGGTRFGIRADGDGLLAAGEPGVQLTWMDARVGEQVITPRIGKPVEINALWYRALLVLQRLAVRAGDWPTAERLEHLAGRVAAVFQQRYLCLRRGYLYDVIDGPDGVANELGERVDASLRPNQIIAVAAAPTLVSRDVARRVVDVCARHLWTPVGLRSLAVDEPGYVARYRGGPAERDAGYHQGTVWSWLLGPFAIAHYYAYGDSAAARRFLRGLAGHLGTGCLGSVSEIFDGHAPHRPEGCFAQAWSVAEVVRAWIETGGELPPLWGERA